MTEKYARVSAQTLRRLPKYDGFMRKMLSEGRKTISCTRIAHEFHLDPTQVRKDIASTGTVGRPRIGFDIRDTIEAIETFLGWNNTNDAFLIGAGSLGAALIGYEGLARHGVEIVAAFDNDIMKIGTEIRGKKILAMEKLFDLVPRMHVQIAILAVPAKAAQDVANQAVLAGVRAIWNLTTVWLDVPETIIVENVDLSSSMAVLSSRLAYAMDMDRKMKEEQDASRIVMH